MRQTLIPCLASLLLALSGCCGGGDVPTYDDSPPAPTTRPGRGAQTASLPRAYFEPSITQSGTTFSVQVLVSWLNGYNLADYPIFDLELLDSNNRPLEPATEPALEGRAGSISRRIMLTRAFTSAQTAQQPALLRVHFDQATVTWILVFDKDQIHFLPQ